ncbi:MAG: hypothetical protein LC647_18540, partial [Beggiatoa sp.]|nr:hypothetical protein [Beggiatoa sp.]
WKATSLVALGASRQGTPRGQRTRACTRVFMRENRDCATRRCFVRMEVRNHHRLAVVAVG